MNRATASLLLLVGVSFASTGCSTAPTAAEQDVSEPHLAPWYSISGMFPSTLKAQFEESIAAEPRAAAALVARGGYLVETVAACGYCHADPQSSRHSLSGGKLLIDATGEGAVPNITPDRETGIGSWSVDQIITAIRAHKRPDETPLSRYAHEGYRWMSNSDARAVAAYLLSLEPVSHAVPRAANRDFGMFVKRPSVAGYVPETPDTQPTVGYGRYLTHSVAGCQRCHSPRDEGDDPEEMLRGSRYRKKQSFLKRLTSVVLTGEDRPNQQDNPGELFSDVARRKLSLEDATLFDAESAAVAENAAHGAIVLPTGAPNIRGSEGLEKWQRADIVAFLKTGETPSGAQAEETCPWEFYQGMGAKDLEAIAAYLKSL